jgi:L-threonylcarbamoyladenylate synthase
MTRLLLPDAGGIAEAAGLLRAGALVAFGTETVYGLGADARQGRAVAEVFAAKGRPHFNPLICHFSSAEAAFAEVQPNHAAVRLAALFWPGPLTMVLTRRAASRIDLLAGAGLDTLAVRVPGHAVARALIAAAGEAIAAPSANRSGGVSPTAAAHVMADLGGRIAAVLDCGATAVGIESTVLDVSGERPRLLRPGGLPVEAIEAAIGAVAWATPAPADAARGLRSPGLLVSHYAPRLPVRLDAVGAGQNEALLAFGAHPPAARLVWNLSESGDVTEAAARLFAGLRWLDAQAPGLGLAGIAAMTVPRQGLGEAINDRLQRAAAPRS